MTAGLLIRLAGAAIVALCLAWIVIAIREDATRDLERAIDRQNQSAKDAADEASLDYDRCRDAGGLWDFGAGQCGRAP